MFSLVLVFAAALLVLYRQERARAAEAQAKIALLEGELKQVRESALLAARRPVMMPKFPQPMVPSPPPVTQLPLQPTPPSESQPAAAKQEDISQAGMKSWWVKQRIAQIEQFTALTEEQRRRLEEKFTAEQKRMEEGSFRVGVDDEEGDTESLADILGSDTADQLQTFQRERREKFMKEHREQEVFSLTRKLGLSTEQEEQVRSALDTVEGTLNEETEAEQKQLAEAGTKVEPTSHMDIFKRRIERRRELLNAQLQGVLSDEQYNKLLEDQATSTPFPFGF